jgi:hypothetical protein
MVKYEEKLERQKVFIDGEWTTSGKGNTYSIINPSPEKYSSNARDAMKMMQEGR